MIDESEEIKLAYVQFIPKPPVIDGGDPGVFVQGTHAPMPLVEQSGVWIHSAGSAILQQQDYRLYTCDKWLWMIVDEGAAVFTVRDDEIELGKGECMVIPPNAEGCGLRNAKDARILWLTIDGPLSTDFLQEMNALSDVPAKQGTLPSQCFCPGRSCRCWCATPAPATPATSWASSCGGFWLPTAARVWP
jgi:hypothetical protein